MKSYNSVFENGKNDASCLDVESIFSNFRDNPGPYKFLTATAKEKKNPDTEALDIAKNINSKLVTTYLQKIKPLLGYSTKENYVEIDAIDSRHIMMSTIIVNYLGKDIKKIVEIGGGFGNWARINEDIINFDSWTIIDLGFVLKLQKWYLSNVLFDYSKIVFLNAEELDHAIADIDLVIGAHSLSEIDLYFFKKYLELILSNTKYFFYSTHVTLPSKELVNYKLTLLDEQFDRVVTVVSENQKVLNILYKIKK